MSTTTPVRVDYTTRGADGIHRGTFTIDRDVWDSMDPQRRTRYVDRTYDAETGGVEGWWEVVNANLSDPVRAGR